MTHTTPQIPFKPETWPVDADGFAPDLCTLCGTPVRYGSRHSQCAPGWREPAPQPQPQALPELPAPELVDQHSYTAAYTAAQMHAYARAALASQPPAPAEAAPKEDRR